MNFILFPAPKRKFTKTNITDIIDRLFELQRLDIDPQYNGEFIELDEIIEDDGKYVKWSDVRKLITDIRISNGL
jgi:Fe-S-cluster formation regulator IscX/YfhJ